MDALTPYSITERYDITFSLPAPPTALSTISLTTSTDGPIPIVPEASTWMMMAIGFAGLGFAGYRPAAGLRPLSPNRNPLVSFRKAALGGLFCAGLRQLATKT